MSIGDINAKNSIIFDGVGEIGIFNIIYYYIKFIQIQYLKLL